MEFVKKGSMQSDSSKDCIRDTDDQLHVHVYVCMIYTHAHTHIHTYTHTVVEDVLLFQNYLLQKQVAPFSVAEGQSAVYTVKLDGPPPNDVAITVNEADNFIRFVSE